MERKLNPEKLKETSTSLSAWIGSEFKGTSLSRIAKEVEILTGEAVETAARIRRPNFFLRCGIFIVVMVMMVGIGYNTYHANLKEITDFAKGFGFMGVYLIGALVFLVTLEFRLKRNKALKAVQELSAMAHIIDMHQLAKDSEIEKFRKDPATFKDKIREYLHACTALLSLISKIGELYIEHFPDPAAIQAVNDFESVCNGLNSKIWQKIIAASMYK